MQEWVEYFKLILSISFLCSLREQSQPITDQLSMGLIRRQALAGNEGVPGKQASAVGYTRQDKSGRI